MSSVDLTKFNAAMLRYKRGTGKTLEESCNRSLKNLLIHTVPIMQKAQKTEITMLRKAPWFNKMITKIYKSKFGAGPVRTRKTSNRRKKRAKTTGVKRKGKNQKKWNKIAKTFISKRVRAIGFLKRIVISGANTVKAKQAKKPPFAIKIKGIFAMFKPATMLHPSALISFGYNYSKRKNSGKGAERMVARALKRAVPVTVKDMETYTAKKLRKLYKS